MIENKLEKLWFNSKESKIYLLILEYKKILPATISYVSKINRTTVYSTLKKLKEKNLISEDIWSQNKYIIALPINNLFNIIEKEKQILLEKENFTENIIKDLSKKFDSKKVYTPKIQYIEEDNIETFLYNNTKKWSTEMISFDNIWWWFQDPSFVKNYLEWMDWQWKNADKNLELRLFTDSWKIEKKVVWRYKKRNVKFSPYFWEINSSMWVLWNYIVTLSTKQHPYFLVETYNPLLAENLRNMFKWIWGK